MPRVISTSGVAKGIFWKRRSIAGSAVVAVMPYEIAEQKAVEVMALAQAYNFPLQVTISPN